MVGTAGAVAVRKSVGRTRFKRRDEHKCGRGETETKDDRGHTFVGSSVSLSFCFLRLKTFISRWSHRRRKTFLCLSTPL